MTSFNNGEGATLLSRNSKGFADICHPEAKPKDLRRFFAGAQNDIKELNDFKKKAAFTLAEVLITLGIIGIVAAMTIPTLISNYQEKQTVSKLQKVYATLKNALEMAKVDNGDYDT